MTFHSVLMALLGLQIGIVVKCTAPIFLRIWCIQESSFLYSIYRKMVLGKTSTDKVVIKQCHTASVFFIIVVAGEQCKVTRELL